MNKVLVIRFSSAGDIVCTTLALQRLRDHYREAEISFLTKDVFARLLESNRSIDRIVPFPSGATLRETIRFGRQLAHEEFDLVVDLHSSTRSRIVRQLLHPDRTVSLNKKWSRRLRPARVAPSIPVPLRYLGTLGSLGIDQTDGPLSIPVDDIPSPLPAGARGFTIAIAPGARHYTKRWPAGRFALSAIDIVGQTSSTNEGTVLLLGGAEETEMCREVETSVRAASTGQKVINLCGKTDWLQTARAISDSTILLTNDSVAGHIAAAVGTPVVSIFGSTIPAFGFAPHARAAIVVEEHGLPCRPCTTTGRAECPRGDLACMNLIAPERVVSAAEELLEIHSS